MHKLIVALLIIIIILLVCQMRHKMKYHCVQKPAAGTTTVSITPSASSSAAPVSTTIPASSAAVSVQPTASSAESFTWGDVKKNASNFSNTLQRKIMNMGGAGSSGEKYNPGMGTFYSQVYHPTNLTS